MAEDAIWSDWDPFLQVLKVAFVNESGVAEYTYRLCLECGVSADLSGDQQGTLWTCAICGAEMRDVS